MTHQGADHPGAGPGLGEIREVVELERGTEAAPVPEPEYVSYLGFFVGSYVYGLPIQQLRAVARVDRLRHVPGAPPSVAGLVNLRGEIICALDTRAVLRLAMPTPADVPFLVVLRGFKDPLGLVVDSITDVYSIDPDQIQPTPAIWPPERTAFLSGTVQVAAGLMGLLDLDRMMVP
jgi:purine-binding chemotaxis protein CheW